MSRRGVGGGVTSPLCPRCGVSWTRRWRRPRCQSGTATATPRCSAMTARARRSPCSTSSASSAVTAAPTTRHAATDRCTSATVSECDDRLADSATLMPLYLFCCNGPTTAVGRRSRRRFHGSQAAGRRRWLPPPGRAAIFGIFCILVISETALKLTVNSKKRESCGNAVVVRLVRILSCLQAMVLTR